MQHHCLHFHTPTIFHVDGAIGCLGRAALVGLNVGAFVGLSVVGQSSKVISHLVRGPTSTETESRKASIQVPEGTEYRSAKLATLDLYAVGPLFKLPVAMKVPVKGATPVLNAFVP
jgi:hypothetical protein